MLNGNVICFPLLGGWDGRANFKVEFKSGGAIEFAEKLKQTAGQGIAFCTLFWQSFWWK